MDCKTFQSELPDLVLTPGSRPSVGAVAHMKSCPPCADEYTSFQHTFAALDSWQVPQPTSYFDQKLGVRLREEQRNPPMGFFERLYTRMMFNTGRNFRPAMVGALALALVAGGGSYVGLNAHPGQPTSEASAAVNDLQILDRNEQAFQQLDALQQDDDTPDSPAPAADGGPIS